MDGLITNIQRFSTHDGPGVRTTVFLKGCTLNCLWCHNPETINSGQQIFYDQEKCLKCGRCRETCPMENHTITEDHIYNRENCKICGKCVEACLYDALCFAAEKRSAKEVIEIVRKDKSFYDSTGGGVTVSGGEPLVQAEFTEELLQLAKSEGIHTALDTAALVKLEKFKKVLKYTDLVLLDLKIMDESLHRKSVGHGNHIILENALWLSQQEVELIVRIPVVHGINATEKNMEETAKFLKEFKNLICVELLPYHELGLKKYDSLYSVTPHLGLQSPESDRLAELSRPFGECGINVKYN